MCALCAEKANRNRGATLLRIAYSLRKCGRPSRRAARMYSPIDDGRLLAIWDLAPLRLRQQHIKQRLGRRNRLAMRIRRADQFRYDVKMSRRNIESLARVR